MILKMQQRVNGLTKRFHNKRPEELNPEKADDLRLIEGRQKNVADLTRQLHRKLNKED